MTAVLLDTSAWVSFFRGEAGRSDTVADLLERATVHTCGPVLLELRRGLRGHEHDRVLPLLERQRFLASGRDDYLRAGQMLAELRGQGVTVPSMDGLIAAIAIKAGMPLLTFDRHFKHFREVELR